MILATQDGVETRLGRELTSSELLLLPGLLEEASALVEGYLGITYTADDVAPAVVAVVVSKMVARALTTAHVEGVDSQRAGPFQVSFTDSTRLWLGKAEKLMLRNIGGGFTSLRFVSGRFSSGS